MRILWRVDRFTTLTVGAWAVAGAVFPVLSALAVARLIGAIASAVGRQDTRLADLVSPLALAAMTLVATLLQNPVGALLAGRARTAVGTRLQSERLRAISTGGTTAYLDDPDVVDALARLDGRVSGIFPGDAPVIAAGVVAGRASGFLACGYIARYQPVTAVIVLATWVVVHGAVASLVAGHAKSVVGATVGMRRAAYFFFAATGPRDAKEVRLFGINRYLADRYRQTQRSAVYDLTHDGRTMRRRVALCSLLVTGAYVTALILTVHALRDGELGYQPFVEILTMLAVGCRRARCPASRSTWNGRLRRGPSRPWPLIV